jgi:hypothetical protein
VSTKAFRILHYTPDPASGARYPVAALAVSDSGVEVHLAPHVPGDACLGGPGRERFFHVLQQRLMKAKDFSRIPGLGPYCELSDPVSLQDDTDANFVSRMVAGWHSAPRKFAERRVSRSVEGYRWLTANRVGKFVKKAFRPDQEDAPFFMHAPALDAISHYVLGTHSLMLLEPLMNCPKIDEDIHKLAQRFGAYSAANSSRLRATDGPHVEMCVYALPGVPDQLLEKATRDIAYSSARVISVSDEIQKAGLLNRITSVAAEANLLQAN